HSHILDPLVGVTALSTVGPRVSALNRLVSDLQETTGGSGQWKSMTPEDVSTFLDDPDRNARGWLGEFGSDLAKELLTWPDKRPGQPYAGGKAKALVGELNKEVEKWKNVAVDGLTHVGVDRGFFAKDDKTFVVQTA